MVKQWYPKLLYVRHKCLAYQYAEEVCIYYQPLATLVDNGHAKFYKSECTVPFENIYLLDDDERAILGVPRPYNKAMRLCGEGMLNSQDFQYKIELLSHIPDGELIAHERGGNIILTFFILSV